MRRQINIYAYNIFSYDGKYENLKQIKELKSDRREQEESYF